MIYITDLNGCKIEVTDLDKAIEQLLCQHCIPMKRITWIGTADGSINIIFFYNPIQILSIKSGYWFNPFAKSRL